MKQPNFTPTSPLTQDAEGTIRLRGSRATLDTLIAVFKSGHMVNQIHEGFPSLSVSQIESVIAWYLNNQADADNYLNERSTAAETLRQQIENRPEQAACREMMRQRRE